MTVRPVRVLLVGFQGQDNLGLRYLAGSISLAGHQIRIESFSSDAAPLISVARRWLPDIVGFSLIFQYMTSDFKQVISALRSAGITAHFTIGGHYASFAPETLLDLIPELDSVVRFEGERTLVELAAAIAQKRSWHNVRGIAWRDQDGVHVTPNREDHLSLDALPWPERGDIDYRAQALPAASMLASRGCSWQCSFCSIIGFYEGNGTRGRRRRDPFLVVDEIEYLVRDRGVRFILFQDDDFLAGGKDARDWAQTIALEIMRRGLEKRLRFKISCRSDEIREDVLAPLIAAGLSYIYLGVESGDPDDLKALTKHITPDVHLRAGQILRRLEVNFDFGFMLLQPWSTVSSVRNNLHFLREFCSDGYAAAGFCRTLPYVGTALEKRMRAEGRLSGPALDADYRFLDSRLDVFWDFALVAFAGRNHGKDATWELLRGLLFRARLDYPDIPYDPGFLTAARTLTAASNELLLDVTEEGLDLIERGHIHDAGDHNLISLARFAREENEQIRGFLNALWNTYTRAAALPYPINYPDGSDIPGDITRDRRMR